MSEAATHLSDAQTAMWSGLMALTRAEREVAELRRTLMRVHVRAFADYRLRGGARLEGVARHCAGWALGGALSLDDARSVVESAARLERRLCAHVGRSPCSCRPDPWSDLIRSIDAGFDTATPLCGASTRFDGRPCDKPVAEPGGRCSHHDSRPRCDARRQDGSLCRNGVAAVGKRCERHTALASGRSPVPAIEPGERDELLAVPEPTRA